jgi:hypothetical protein
MGRRLSATSSLFSSNRRRLSSALTGSSIADADSLLSKSSIISERDHETLKLHKEVIEQTK